MKKPKRKDVERLAEQLHIWFLEANKKILPKSYNPNAIKGYSELAEDQKDIDRYIAKALLDDCLISFKSTPKVNGEYQCKHVKEKVIDGYCVWCALTVAEKGLAKQKEMRIQAKRYSVSTIPSVDEIADLLINTVHLDEPLRISGARVNGNDSADEIIEDISQAIYSLVFNKQKESL